MAITTVLSAKVADVVSGEIGRSAVNSRSSNGPKTLSWGMTVLTGECSVYSFSVLNRKCLFCR
jgi:hypothetical protein